MTQLHYNISLISNTTLQICLSIKPTSSLCIIKLSFHSFSKSLGCSSLAFQISDVFETPIYYIGKILECLAVKHLFAHVTVSHPVNQSISFTVADLNMGTAGTGTLEKNRYFTLSVRKSTLLKFVIVLQGMNVTFNQITLLRCFITK